MGMPRKGSRIIDVDGHSFRWRLNSRKHRYSYDEPELAVGHLTVQQDLERPGHVFQQWLHWYPGTSVTPEIVREVIRRALDAGWDPNSRKKPKEPGAIDVESIDTKMSVIKQVHDS